MTTPTITLQSAAPLPVEADDACAASVSGAIDDALRTLERNALDIHKEIDWATLRVEFEPPEPSPSFMTLAVRGNAAIEPHLSFAVEVV